VYWLSVVAVYRMQLDEIEYPWGWTNRSHLFGSSAVRISLSDEGTVREPIYDQIGEPVDMSFSLLTAPETALPVGQIHYSKSTDNGAIFEPGSIVDENDSGPAQINPHIAVDGQGIIHVVW